LEDPAEHQRLRVGALAVAQRFDLHRHVSQLSQLFAQIAEPSATAQGRETSWY
jgi:hypothetical protein